MKFVFKYVCIKKQVLKGTQLRYGPIREKKSQTDTLCLQVLGTLATSR